MIPALTVTAITAAAAAAGWARVRQVRRRDPLLRLAPPPAPPASENRARKELTPVP